MSGLSPGRWEQVSAILDEVLELPPEEVGSTLDDLCGDDTELRQEVEVMLEACAKAEHLMDRPPAINVKDILASTGKADRGKIEPGDIVGVYRIVELIGRGGMGAVYLAERADGEFERQVALKVVKRGMDSEEILDRFRAERQILAGLKHPNIAGLLDGGITADGRPFFAMELSKGEAIDSYCDRLRLSLRQRIELFLVVCDAVQHAHRNLVVHRDLKPGNITVTPQGEVKLLDFGIAKVLDPHRGGDDRTKVMGVRLTPEYAAPEQIMLGPTTTATDVYALGVVLYELLSGKRPYVLTNGSMSEIEEVVCKTEPRRPSTRVVFRDSEAKEETSGLPRSSWLRSTDPGTLRQSLSGDLDSIILKALEKDPERRYGSAAELKQDLDNFIHGRPVEARAQTRLYRLGKFVRRNVLVVGLGTAAVLALVVGAGVATAMGLEARRQGALALEEANRAEQTRDFMVSVFEEFDPNTRGGRELSADALVEVGLSKREEFEGQPLLAGSSYNVLGQIAVNLGRRELADSIFKLSLEALQEADSIVAARMIADALRGRAGVFNSQFDSASLALLRHGIELRDQVGDSAGLYVDLISLAETLNIHSSGRSGRAGRARARDLLHSLDDAELDALLEARRRELLGDLWLYEQAYDSALVYYDQAIQVRTASLGADYVDNAGSMWGEGRAYLELGRPAEAEAVLAEANRILMKTYGERHPRVAQGWLRLARAIAAQGRYRAVVATVRRSLAALDTVDTSQNVTQIAAREVLAHGLQETGHPGQALAQIERASILLAETPRVRAPARIAQWVLRHEIEQANELWDAALASLQRATAVRHPTGVREVDLGFLRERGRAFGALIDLEERLGKSESAAMHRIDLVAVEASIQLIEDVERSAVASSAGQS